MRNQINLYAVIRISEHMFFWNVSRETFLFVLGFI